jgi:hypothetical protein
MTSLVKNNCDLVLRSNISNLQGGDEFEKQIAQWGASKALPD